MVPLIAQTSADTLTCKKQELLIPIYDGIRLNTLIYTPTGIEEPLPILILRKSYNIHNLPSPNYYDYINTPK